VARNPGWEARSTPRWEARSTPRPVRDERLSRRVRDTSVEPEIAVVVAEEADWDSSQPFGLAFFSDEAAEIRPGVVVMPVGGGDFWVAMVRDLRDATPRGYAKLRATYPDGGGGVDLQPFFDLMRPGCSMSTARTDWFASGIAFTQPIASSPARSPPLHRPPC
jgi:hypothetical protein